MTLEEIGAFVAECRVVRHNGAAFVCLYNEEDAAAFAGAGAHVTRQEVRGSIVREAHLYAMLDAPAGDDAPDNRRLIVLDYFRERDGDTRRWWQL